MVGLAGASSLVVSRVQNKLLSSYCSILSTHLLNSKSPYMMEAATGNRYLSFNVLGDPYWRQEMMYDGGYGKVYGNFYYLGCHWKLLWKYNNLDGDTVEERPEEVTVQKRLLEGEEEGSSFGASIGFAGKGFSLNMRGEKYDKT